MANDQTRASLIKAMAQALAPRLYDGAEYVLTNADKRRATAALAAIEAHNGGCVVVPREATFSMCAAHLLSVGAFGKRESDRHWRAMVAASPYAPEDKA